MAFGIGRLEAAVNQLVDQLQALTTRVETLDSTVETGFRETCTLINGTSSETRRVLGEAINQVRQDLAPRIEVIRADLNRLHRPESRPASVLPGAGPEPKPTPEPQAETQSTAFGVESARTPTSHQAEDDYKKHLQALLAAASVTTVRLNCHRDLWAFLVDKAAHAAHFCIPGDVKDLGNGRTQVALSGPSLMAALTVLWELRHDRKAGEEIGDWAQAVVLYSSIAAALQVLEGGARSTDDEHVDIVIDLRRPTTPAEEDEAQTKAASEDANDSDGSEEPPEADS